MIENKELSIKELIEEMYEEIANDYNIEKIDPINNFRNPRAYQRIYDCINRFGLARFLGYSVVRTLESESELTLYFREYWQAVMFKRFNVPYED